MPGFFFGSTKAKNQFLINKYFTLKVFDFYLVISSEVLKIIVKSILIKSKT